MMGVVVIFRKNGERKKESQETINTEEKIQKNDNEVDKKETEIIVENVYIYETDRNVLHYDDNFTDNYGYFLYNSLEVAINFINIDNAKDLHKVTAKVKVIDNITYFTRIFPYNILNKEFVHVDYEQINEKNLYVTECSKNMRMSHKITKDEYDAYMDSDYKYFNKFYHNYIISRFTEIGISASLAYEMTNDLSTVKCAKLFDYSKALIKENISNDMFIYLITNKVDNLIKFDN